MEYKAEDIITYNENGETIYLKVTPTRDITCRECYFKGHIRPCATLRNIIGNCTKDERTDKQSVIFIQLNNNVMKKKIIDIYTVMQVHKRYRSFCDVFTSFEEADTRFENLLKYFKDLYKIQPRGWTTESIPSQIKVSIIGDMTLYLCKETKELNTIIENIPENISNKSEIKPFFCANNCFNESIKHTPFGILKDNTDKYYTILDISKDGISILSDNHSLNTISFKFASTFLKYVDGSPFGWLCEK